MVKVKDRKKAMGLLPHLPLYKAPKPPGSAQRGDKLVVPGHPEFKG
jgi:hypothetical protein